MEEENYIILDKTYNILPKIKFLYSNTYNDCYFHQKNVIKEILDYKNKIENLNNTDLWDKQKKLTNNYELVYIHNKRNKRDSIALYNPLSRAYFKLWEILVFLNNHSYNIFKNKKINIGCLAEGPGGFMEALINFRGKYFNKEDNIFSITLKSTNKNIPGWNKATQFLKNNKNVNISYGEDGTGNLYLLKNILNFKKSINTGLDIITADGGIDYSKDFNKQEQLSYRIIFCEIVTALSTQKIGGIFICKFFDLFSDMTIKMLFLLKNCYKELKIFKPFTSRPANSEKYIICSGFIGINQDYLNKLYCVVKLWERLEDSRNSEYIVISIFDKDFNVPNDFLTQIYNFNIKNSNNQIKNIKETLELINIYNKTYYKNIVSKLIKNQKNIAILWCKKNDIKINYNSVYIKKY